MISVRDLEIRIGARVLMSEVNFRVDKGDKVGLVGRNGAGKTTLTKILAGDGQPSKGFVDRGGEIGYLPQDPRSGDPEELARTRILNARGLGDIAAEMAKCTEDMGSIEEAVYNNAMNRYSELEERFQAAGGYAAEAEAATIASNLNLKDHILDQPLKTLSGGQRRRIELARILFSNAETMILDEPTNHLDADSVVWLREFLKGYQGGLIVISHDVDLVEETVNRVFYLDAIRCVIDIYNMGWRQYQKARETDEERRKRERRDDGVFHRKPEIRERRNDAPRKRIQRRVAAGRRDEIERAEERRERGTGGRRRLPRTDEPGTERDQDAHRERHPAGGRERVGDDPPWGDRDPARPALPRRLLRGRRRLQRLPLLRVRGCRQAHGGPSTQPERRCRVIQ